MKSHILSFAAILSAFIFASCSHDAKLATTSAGTLQARTAIIGERDVPRLIPIQGTIQAEDDAVLSSRAMGPVVRERVRLGDHVRKGEILLEIDERMNGGMLAQAQGALAQAEAAAALAATNFRRFQALYETKACSQLELDLARMQHETATGAVRQALGAVEAAGAVADERMIRAPFDGVIVEKFVSVGDLVSPGRPLIRVQTAQGRDLQFTVRSTEAAQVTLGTTFFCILDHTQAEMQATITEIAPAADPLTHSVTVKAKLKDADSLAAGYTASAELPGESIRVLLAPRSAIYATGGLQLVSIVDAKAVAQTRAVTVGRAYGEDVEILSGLVAGDTVVLERTGLIAEGTRIERKQG
jgi:RND family efflux transporter MFP subunit